MDRSLKSQNFLNLRFRFHSRLKSSMFLLTRGKLVSTQQWLLQ